MSVTAPIPVFYSTNAWLKFYVSQNYGKRLHYVWCSDAFDPPRNRVEGASYAAPSSSPVGIYRRLLEDWKGEDGGSLKIAQQRQSLITLASKWRREGDIDEKGFQNIAYLVKHSNLNYWRPLIYVIPQHAVAPARVREVPQKDWANKLFPEYIISDLVRSEFDVLEPVDDKVRV